MRMHDFHCGECGAVFEMLIRSDDVTPVCRVCGSPSIERIYVASATARGDEIPGGIDIAHGICNPDGSPRRYYSRSEIKAACEVRGFVPYHDVYQEGGNQRLADARHREDYIRSGEGQRAKKWRDEARAEKRLAERR